MKPEDFFSEHCSTQDNVDSVMDTSVVRQSSKRQKRKKDESVDEDETELKKPRRTRSGVTKSGAQASQGRTCKSREKTVEVFVTDKMEKKLTLAVDDEVNAMKDEIKAEIIPEIRELKSFASSQSQQNNIALNICVRDLPENEEENTKSNVDKLIKKQVLTNKSDLKDNRQYEDVFIGHDQTAAERRRNDNFRTIIRALKNSDILLRSFGAFTMVHILEKEEVTEAMIQVVQMDGGVWIDKTVGIVVMVVQGPLWKDYFSSLFRNDVLKDAQALEPDPCRMRTDDSGFNGSISILEVRNAILTAKNGKAVGVDEIPAEVLKNDTPWPDSVGKTTAVTPLEQHTCSSPLVRWILFMRWKTFLKMMKKQHVGFSPAIILHPPTMNYHDVFLFYQGCLPLKQFRLLRPLGLWVGVVYPNFSKRRNSLRPQQPLKTLHRFVEYHARVPGMMWMETNCHTDVAG
ncbi:hypothetical protein DPMN_145131 [Dreissena polymorpha]|uniref:Uncharacterized protein n=1 Tax=Dreissena polymorpha TaxID=45954 RepID=A0A9D4F9A1_DREPO|nr:hypothetical protein DPMN_145131 [Dreissena polymorpha]